MRIQVNGEVIEADGVTVFELMIDQCEAEKEGLVVVINSSVVPKHQWEFTRVNETDSVLIFTPAEGG